MSVASTTEFLYGTTSGPNHSVSTTFEYEPRQGGVPYGYRHDNSRSFEQWMKALWDLNEGEVNGIWRNQKSVSLQMRRNIADAVASQLDLYHHRKDRVISLMAQVDGRKYSNVGGLAMVAFCLCQIVCDDDPLCLDSNRYFYPTANPEKNDPRFQKVFEDFEFDPQITANTIQKLRYDLGIV